jgi:3',5'-cyclic AMP phosphodiesterase CpdA
MRLLAIGDLHLSNPINRKALLDIPDHRDDWLIIAGDVAESLENQDLAFRELGRRFEKMIWVPGNHDLWSVPRDGVAPARGVARYRTLVDLARAHGAATPEDAFLEWPAPGPNGERIVIAPLFLLYDYSFRPTHVGRSEIRRWAREGGASCGDEIWLHPDPFPNRESWCWARCRDTARRLEALAPDRRTVLINHWPLRADLIRIPRIPRFTPWCGTVLTDDWHRRFRAVSVVSGHLHTRRTDMLDGCRFEEVSLGYPRQWRQEEGIDAYFRIIL